MKKMLAMALGIGVLACGSEKPEFSDVPDYLQNVNFIPYRLTKMEVHLELENENGNHRSIQFNFKGQDLDDEVIARVTEGDGFILQINGKASNIEVGASARLAGGDTRSREVARCQLIGESKASGLAEFNRLDLDYSLNARIQGNDCPASIWDRQLEFISEQIEGLGLEQVLAMRDAGLLFLNNSDRFHMRIRISGITRVDN